MNNIKRNKKIFDYFKEQLLRLGINTPVKEIFEQYILVDITASEAINIAPILDTGITSTILDNDTVLIETLKLIGLMEASKDEKELQKLLEKKEKIKDKKKEKTDFDKILGGILKVPKPKND